MSRLFEIARDRIVPPWHMLYWMPVAEAPDPPTNGPVMLRIVRTLGELNRSERQALERSVGASAIPIFERRLLQGNELYILFSGESVAGTMFLVFGRECPFQHTVLTDRDAMVLDARIDPKFRGRRLYAVFLSRSLASLKQNGAERLFIDCAERNKRSIRSFSRVGFQFLLRYRVRGGQYRFDTKPH